MIQVLTPKQSDLVGKWYRYAQCAARIFAGSYGRRWGIRHDEFYDRAVDGLIAAARSYDPARSNACPWFQFMAFCVHGHLRKKDRKKRIIVIDCVDMDIIADRNDNGHDTDECECLEKIFDRLSARRQKILVMLINDRKSDSEIARTMGLTHQGVSKIRMDVTRKLLS